MDLRLYLQPLEKKAEAMVDQIMQWSNINSHSYNIPGLKKMANVLTEAFSVLECQSETHPLLPLDHINSLGLPEKMPLGSMLRFWKRPAAPIQVLLIGHMDTVFETTSSFQTAIRTSKGLIHGPGVTDMKGGLCVMLEALKTFEQSDHNQQLGWEVIINPDEELGSFSSAPLFEERAKFHQVGLLFEPAMDEKGTLAGDRKGSGNFTVIVRGRAAHAGRAFSEGRNAIVECAKVIVQIDALNGQREGVTINVGHMQGGGSVNVVPELAICHLDIRILKMEDGPWVEEKLRSIVAAAQQTDGYKVELIGKMNRKPKTLKGKTQALYDLVAEIGKELGEVITWKPSGGCCDGNNLSAVGLPNIDTLGVCGGNIHSPEEYCLIESLVPRAKLTAAILLRLSEGKFTG